MFFFYFKIYQLLFNAGRCSLSNSYGSSRGSKLFNTHNAAATPAASPVSTAAGMTAAMYSLFSAAEFIGRTVGGTFAYKLKIKPEKRFSFAFLVYIIYETMDMILLWIPYPLMLVNRGICGFLGINSATMRQAAVQTYIPDELRSRINAFEGMLYFAVSAVLGLVVGALGEVLDYRICITLCGASTMACCLLTIWKNRGEVALVYTKEGEAQE